MGRGTAFTFSEDQFLVDTSETKTAKELYEDHEEVRGDRMWPQRSAKSLARRVERLRETGVLGKRDDETRRKAYYGRNRIRGE